MKAKPTVVFLNNQWGYQYAAQAFPSKRKAIEYARQLIKLGFAWHYYITK